eukprot:COSAG02_NODE_1295_length_13400_cov_5.691828_7_plen_428_part_00
MEARLSLSPSAQHAGRRHTASHTMNSSRSSAGYEPAELSVRSRAITERANAIISQSAQRERGKKQSPRSAGKSQLGRHASMRGGDAETPRSTERRPRRIKTAEELVEQLGLSTVGVRPGRAQWDRPWDRLTQAERAAWLAEHSPRASPVQPSWSSPLRSPTERGVAQLAPSTVSGTAATALAHQGAFAEGVPPLSRMVAFLGDCELAHLAPSLIELKYITPQDLVDAGDDELLGVLSRLRYRMAPPERRRFVRTVVAVKHEAGVHTALTLESVQVLGHGSVIADLKADRRSLELAPNEVHEGEPDSMHFLGEPEPEPEPEQSRFTADRSGEHTAETRVPAYRPGDLETFLDGLREARANNPSAAAVPAVAAPAGVANVCVPSETSAAIAAAVAISRSTRHSQDKAKRRNSAYDAAHILAQVSTDKMF